MEQNQLSESSASTGSDQDGTLPPPPALVATESTDTEEPPYSPVPTSSSTVTLPPPVICGDCTIQEPAKEASVPPVHRLVVPADIVAFSKTDEVIHIVGTKEGKVTKIRGLEGMSNLKTLVLRSCLVSVIEGLNDSSALEKLELYDNHVEEIQNIAHLSQLKVLDLSFNSIREMVPLGDCCPMLEELYIAQNKLRKIEGLTGLLHLRTLDLGANRIRVIEGLETTTGLKSLWLGKNKIETISGLGALSQLRQLDIQHNRIESIGDGLAALTALEELYLAWNAIGDLTGLPCSPLLNTVDLSRNKISSLEGVEAHPSLEELWLSNSLIDSFEALSPLSLLPALTCLYLEHSPIAKDFEYRKTLTRSIPTLQQLDATMVNRTIS